MEKRVIIERAKDGTFSCYAEKEMDFVNAIFGYGNTAEEAKADFLEAYNEAVLEFGENAGYTFVFAYDVPSFLQSFSKKFSLAGLQTITGINRKQLSHYINGNSRPSKRTVKKMERGIKDFEVELKNISFV